MQNFHNDLERTWLRARARLKQRELASDNEALCAQCVSRWIIENVERIGQGRVNVYEQNFSSPLDSTEASRTNAYAILHPIGGADRKEAVVIATSLTSYFIDRAFVSDGESPSGPALLVALETYCETRSGFLKISSWLL